MVPLIRTGEPENETSVALDGRSTVVVRRFMEVVERDLGRPLYMLDICMEIGVAGRTLRKYCLGHLGMAPGQYLWLRRMNLARRALAQGHRNAASVTEIANEFGFGELGRFAVRYRQLFGEAPSVTLRRSASLPAGTPTLGSEFKNSAPKSEH